MLSLNDFKEKQILFIRNPENLEARIKFNNDNIVYTKSDGEINQLSCHKILAIFIIGDTSFTSVSIRKAVKFGISVFLMNRNFDTYAAIESKAEGNYFLRMKQYSVKDEIGIAKNLVKNKLFNLFSLVEKDKRCGQKINDYASLKKEIADKIKKARNEKELLGIEGNYTKKFFKIYFKELKWYKRMPRVKIDEYNLLLDIGYTFLLNFIDSLLRLYGFDVYKGFYHKLFFKRRSLSCDLIEPFRCIINKQLIKSYRLGQINKKDFKMVNGQYFLSYDKSEKYVKIFFEAIFNKKVEIFNYIYDFYRFIMDSKRNFPYFKIK